jgi:hypothetical protein
MKIIFRILGVLITSFGLFFIVINLSILNFGYTFKELIQYIFSSIAIYLLIIGIFLILLSFRRTKR